MPPTAFRGLPLAGAAVSLFLLAGCGVDISMGAEAKDQWQRHYTLTEGGMLEIRNTNGLIQVEPGEGQDVTVSADRVVKAATDEAAKAALAAFEIQESSSPDHISLDSTRRTGMNLNVNLNRRVDFHVRVPRSTNVRLNTTNGNIEVTGPLSGTFRAETTNGQVHATGLENSAKASTTNGEVSLQIARVGEDGVSCETTNGRIELVVPPNLNARLSARVTNGGIRTEGLTLTSISEQSRRRLEGTFGSGGPSINLETTNGAVEIRGGN
jgi:hypothetical protein